MSRDLNGVGKWSCETMGWGAGSRFQVEGKGLRWTNKEAKCLECGIDPWLETHVLFLPECRKMEDSLYRVTSLENFKSGLV